MAEKLKRARSQNISLAEKHLLVELCEKHRGIIENKKTDVYTVKEKEDCWKKIAAEFNATGSQPRDWQQLKHVCLQVIFNVY